MIAAFDLDMGYQEPDKLGETLYEIINMAANEEKVPGNFAVLHYKKNVDLIPANISLSSVEVSLATAFCRESILKTYVDQVRDAYDYVIIDCMPSLGVLTVNVFTSTDSVLIPVQAAYLPVKGLQQLLKTMIPCIPDRLSQSGTKGFRFSVMFECDMREDGTTFLFKYDTPYEENGRFLNVRMGNSSMMAGAIQSSVNRIWGYDYKTFM